MMIDKSLYALVIDKKFFIDAGYIAKKPRVEINLENYSQNHDWKVSPEELENFKNGKYKAVGSAEGAFANNQETKLIMDIDTSEVTNMQRMFQSCPNLVSLDISSFDTSNLSGYMPSMFMLENNPKLKHLKVGKKWTIDGTWKPGYMPSFGLEKEAYVYAEPSDIERIKKLFPDNTVKTWNEWKY